MAVYAGIDDFTSYSNGNLAGNNGGSGWSGAWGASPTAPQVESTTVFTASKAVGYGNTVNAYLKRTLTSSVDSGNMYFAMMAPTVAVTAAGYAVVEITPSTVSDQFYIQIVGVAGGASSNLVVGSTTVTHLLDGITANVWYIININFLSSTTAKVRWKASGGSWSAFTGTLTYGASATNPDTVSLATNIGGGATNYYVSQIGTSDPDVVAALAPVNKLLTQAVKRASFY